METRKLSPEAIEAAKKARAWAKSDEAQEAIKEAVRVAEEADKRMKDAQEPMKIPYWWFLI
jgi:hypothetical protein